MNPKQRILIVDDVPVNIKILDTILMENYDIIVATSGREALVIATSANNKPDLILLDIMMPGMDGYEVCRSLKDNPNTRNIPIIFITARSGEKDETKGFEFGAVDYITKPITPEIVRARVQTQLDLKQHRDHLKEMVSERTTKLAESNDRLKWEIARRMSAQLELRRSHADLEKRVEERTIELSKANRLLKQQIIKQEINIDLAKNILSLINGQPERHIYLRDNLTLFCTVINLPCHAEGGDHFFVRRITDKENTKTIISLKDQSGHEVGCVLRSIITDLIHNALLKQNSGMPLDTIVTFLNNEIINSRIINPEDYFTSINAEIDHNSLMLQYLSTGHPPFLLLRNGEVRALPYDDIGTNLPVNIQVSKGFSKGQLQLKPDDKLIFYTDGLTEMPHQNNKTIVDIDCLKTMAGAIIEDDASISVGHFMQHLLTKIADFSGEEAVHDLNTSADDITLLGLELERSEWHQENIRPSSNEDITRIINRLYSQLEDVWEKNSFQAPEIRLRAVLDEAIINAWKHGSCQNPKKSISLYWRLGNDFHLEVLDQGSGFKYAHLPNPTSPENITRPNGRGLYIISKLAGSVTWHDQGRRISISFPEIYHRNRDDSQTNFLDLWQYNSK